MEEGGEALGEVELRGENSDLLREFGIDANGRLLIVTRPLASPNISPAKIEDIEQEKS